MFFFIILPHLARADRRGDHDRDDLPAFDLRRDPRHHQSGGPGNATTNLAFLIYARAAATSMSAAPRRAASSRSCWPTSSPSSSCAPSPAASTRGLRDAHAPQTKRSRLTVLGWLVGAARLLPDLLDGADRFKTELDAVATPPHAVLLADAGELRARCFAGPTTGLRPEQHLHFGRRAPCWRLLFAIPAAYAMAFHPTQAAPRHLCCGCCRPRCCRRSACWCRSICCSAARVCSTRSRADHDLHR